MAGEATIGALRVVLGADTAKFEDNLSKAGKSLAGFGKKIGEIAGGIQLQKTLETTARALVNLVTGAIDAADAMGKAAQKFGVPVEQLSSLSYAAELSDVSLEQLGTSLGKLSKNMIAAQSGTNDQAAAFKALGISVTDSNKQLKSSDQVLLEIANSFSKFEDGTTKTALAMALFGRAGAEMIPLLNLGAAGIEKMRKEAERLGLVIDGQTAKAAEQFNDNLKTLHKTTDAMVLRLLGSSGLLVAMGQLTERFINAAADGKNLTDIGNGVGRALQYIVVWVDALTFSLSALTLPFRAIVAAFYNLSQGKFHEAWLAIKNRVVETGQAGVQAAASIANLNKTFVDTDNTGDQVVATMELLAKAYERLGAGPVFNTNKAVAQFIESTKKSIAVQEAELKTFGMAAGARERLRLQLEAEAIAKANNTTLTAEQRKELDALGISLENVNQKLAGQKLIEETLPMWDRYQAAIAKANEEISKLNPTLEQTEAVNKKVAEKFGLTWEQQSASIAGSMGDIVSTFAGENKKLVGVAKTLHAAQALIAAYAGAAEALALPFPANLAASATVLAKGLALVAAIQSIGFAQGGSFKVGGAGGTDSKLVQFMASPGEMVDVRKPGQESAGAAQEITVNMRGRDLISRDMVRDLFAALNDGTRDGYRLKLAEA